MITLALVGRGKWGSHFVAAAKAVGADIVTVADSRTDLAKMPDVDGIIIATPASTHYALTLKFLRLGKNLFIEKPLALKSAEAQELKTIWGVARPKVLVGHLHLYNPAYRMAKTLIPALGTLESMSFQGLGSPMREDVSVLWDWGPHPASLFLDLAGPINLLSASGNRHHVTFAAKSEKGVCVKAEMGWEYACKMRMLTLKGAKGTLVMDDTQADHKVALTIDNKTTFPAYEKTPPLQIELKEFVAAISGEMKITSDIETGVRVVELLSQIERML